MEPGDVRFFYCLPLFKKTKNGFKTHHIAETKIAEIISDDSIINQNKDGINLLGNVYYQGFDEIIIFEKILLLIFFDLKTGIAGEILQKFSIYGVRLAIVGDFTKNKSKSLKDFIYESNKSRLINFVFSITDAIKTLTDR